MTGQGPVLRIETDPTQVAVARGFAVAALQVMDVDPHIVESVRLAVSELVTVQVENGVQDISVEADPDHNRLVIACDRPPPEIPDAVASILSAIDGIRVESHDDAWTIEWSAR